MPLEVSDLAYRTCDYIAYLYKRPETIHRFMQESARNLEATLPVWSGLMDVGIVDTTQTGNFEFTFGYLRTAFTSGVRRFNPLPKIEGKELYFTDKYDAGKFAEMIKKPELDIESRELYSAPKIMDERAWIVVRKKIRNGCGGSAEEDLLDREILTTSMKKGYSVRLEGGRRIMPIAGRICRFVQEKDAEVFRTAMNHLFELMKDPRNLIVEKD